MLYRLRGVGKYNFWNVVAIVTKLLRFEVNYVNDMKTYLEQDP